MSGNSPSPHRCNPWCVATASGRQLKAGVGDLEERVVCGRVRSSGAGHPRYHERSKMNAVMLCGTMRRGLGVGFIRNQVGLRAMARVVSDTRH